MATSQPPWVVYANQMFPQGLGYPLWIPEPDPRAAREVALGDVGWLSDGAFFQLFNARVESAEEQLRASVPDEFEPFNPPNLIIRGPMPAVAEPPLCSRTVKAVEISGAAQASSPMSISSAGVNFSFTCTDNSGALLMFSPAAVTEEIMSRRHIITYMSKHFEHWLEFANGKYGLDLKEEHIMFVCGTTKTARWAVAALQGNYKKKSGSVSADLSSSASLNMSVSISNHALPQTHRKFGPSRSLAAPAAVGRRLEYGEGRGQAATDAGPEPCDQCIFVHYYQMKRRLWFLSAIKAAAGPHELPPSEDDDIEASRTDNIWNPVNDLLDYILENSDAALAIASDLDILALFKDKPFPEDVAIALRDLKPKVEVDEDGVGTVESWVVLSSRTMSDEAIQESAVRPTELAEGDLEGASPSPPSTSPIERQDLSDDDSDYDEFIPKQKTLVAGAQTSVHDGSITALVCSPSGQYAASGSEDMSLIIWDVLQSRMLFKLQHGDTVSALAFSPDGAVLASGSSDQTVRIIAVANGQVVRTLDTGVAIHALAFSPDGTALVAGAYDGQLLVWDPTTYARPTPLRGHAAAVTFAVFSPDGRYLATGGTESVCWIWNVNVATRAPQCVLRGHRGMVCRAAFAPDGERIVTASDDWTSRVWRAATGEALVILREHSGPVWAVAFAPDGRHVASGSADGTVRVCDSYSGARVFVMEGHGGMVSALEYSPDGRFIASAAADSTVRLWRATDGKAVATYNEHGDGVTAVAFARNGLTLASGSHDGTVHFRLLPHIYMDDDYV